MAASRYRHFVANSTTGFEHLVRELGVAEDRIGFIPNAVEQPAPTPGADWRARLGLSPDQLLVVKVADLEGARDHATVLRAWQSVQTNWPAGPRPVLALAGTFGDAYADCHRMVRKSGVDQSVRFLGPLKDPQALIAACDLAVFSSRAEGMPNSVLEYMAAGKAVLASDLPGIRDALGAGSSAALVPPGDAETFARKLPLLLGNSELRRSLGRANHARAQAEFSTQVIADAYLSKILELRGMSSPAPNTTLPAKAA